MYTDTAAVCILHPLSMFSVALSVSMGMRAAYVVPSISTLEPT